MVEVRHLLIVSLGLMTAMAFNYAFADTTNFATSLTFHDTTSNTDRLIIANNGFVGIGVSPTTVMVDVKSPTNAGYRLQADNGVASQSVVSTGGNAQFRLRDLDFGKTFDIRLIDNTGRLEVFDTALGSARIVVTTTGDVGIGTITPLAKLDVAGNIRLTGNIISPNDICIGACP